MTITVRPDDRIARRRETSRRSIAWTRTPDPDPQETQEWLDALDGVLAAEGPGPRALPDRAADRQGAPVRRVPAVLGEYRVHQHDPASTTQVKLPGRPGRSSRRSATTCAGTRWRWCCARTRTRTSAATSRASRPRRRSTTSASTTSGMRRPTSHGGDLVFVQGHSAPGVYARAFMLGRLTDEQMDNFRQEVDGKGISSYPHPWLMPDFWQFPTVSMGLGPLMAIYQARFMKYLQDRGLANTEGRKVWAFMGDGEMDEPESMGAIGMASRENARQPDLRRQLQPAAPRRAGARQRQDHPGARERLPRRGLERDQGRLGHALGSRCSRATRRAS